MPIKTFYMPPTKRKRLCRLLPAASGAILFAILFAAPIDAKTIPAAPRAPSGYTAASVSFVNVYEARMRLFFESRRAGPAALSQLPAAQLPQESDFLLLQKLWNRLSPEFKALYKSAIQIPDSFKVYVSPGGNFEVYYNTSDTSIGVDTTDTIGYGAGPGNWRQRLPVSNGVPDYIDELAWALDSSWSMEVGWFGFAAPLPYKDNIHVSDRYKVVTTWIGTNYYGVTYPHEKANGAPKGYTSHIEIRNNWKGSVWEHLGYDRHPENGIRVTCAHELFHAVQYAMAWNVDFSYMPDDFPLTWLEGSAVLMEERGFDYINDYLQYAGTFFLDPKMSFFDSATDMRVYSNSLLSMFLYEKTMAAPRIDFIRTVFFNNYASPASFHPNLRATALASGSPWASLLNRFHTGSYFTGSRADTARFLADAGLMGKWNCVPDVFGEDGSLVKQVNAYGMQIFDFTADTSASDTFSFNLRTDRFPDTLPYPTWAASCIVRKPAKPDSVFPLSIDTSGHSSCRITGWSSRCEVLCIVTNGHPTLSRNVTVYTRAMPDTFGRFVIFPNPVRLRGLQREKQIRFEGSGIKNIRIYGIDGKLVWNSQSTMAEAFERYPGGIIWKLANSRNRTVVPGCYRAMVTRTNSLTGEEKTTLHKILVTP